MTTGPDTLNDKTATLDKDTNSVSMTASDSDVSLPKKRIQEISIILTIIGVLGFCTALPRIFTGLDSEGQVPQMGLMIFGFWLALIIAAFFLSRRLLKDEASR